MPVETAAPPAVSDPLADERAALAKITDTAQNWNKGGTVLDGAAEFASRAAEETRDTPAVQDAADTSARTEDRARTFAAEQGYGASKAVFEGAEPQKDARAA